MTGLHQMAPGLSSPGRRYPRLHSQAPGRTDRAGGAGRQRTAGGPGGGHSASVSHQRVRRRAAHRLGCGAGRPDLPAGFPTGRHAPGRGRRARSPACWPGRPRRPRSARPRTPCGSGSTRIPPGQLALNIPDAGRRAAARGPAQISGNRAGVPQTGADLPRLLHLLLPVGPVRGRAGPQDGHRRHRPGSPPTSAQHPEVTSVLITGGDPMIMGAAVLRRYIEPLLDPELGHIESVRIGTKSLGLLAAALRHRPGLPTTPCGCSRRSWPRARAWPSWLTSPIPGSSSRRWWRTRCAGSGRPAR